MAKARLLVVDDEEVILHLVTAILADHGFDVTTATNGKIAFELCSSAKLPFDFLLSDVMMPEMDGPGLARQLRNSGIKVPMLFMTGFSVSDNDLGIPVIRKPFANADLLTAVQTMLSKGRASSATS